MDSFRESAMGVRRTDDRGGVSIEYALLGAVVALGIVSALVVTKNKLSTNLNVIAATTAMAVNAGVPRTVVSTVAMPSVVADGITQTVTKTTYSDGTYRIEAVAQQATWYKTVLSDFDAAGILTRNEYVYPTSGSRVQEIQYIDANTNFVRESDVDGTFTYTSHVSYKGDLSIFDSTVVDPGTKSGLYTSTRYVNQSTPTGYQFYGVSTTYADGRVVTQGANVSGL